MVRQTTKKQKVDTLTLLYEIETKVERYQKVKTRADKYSTLAEKVKGEIFTALEAVDKDELALHSEKINRICKRLIKQSSYADAMNDAKIIKRLNKL